MWSRYTKRFPPYYWLGASSVPNISCSLHKTEIEEKIAKKLPAKNHQTQRTDMNKIKIEIPDEKNRLKKAL